MDDASQRELIKPVEQASARVFVGQDAPDRWIGSAFAIGPRAFLTALHVVKGHGPHQVFLGAPAFDPPQRVQRIEAHPLRDVALLLLDPAVPARKHWLPIADRGVAQGDTISSCGFPAWHQSLNVVPTVITAFEGSASQYVAKPQIAKGMSGGPVLRDGRVAGVVVARDVDKGDHYLISLDSFRAFLDEHAATIAADGAALTPEQQALLTALRTVSAEAPIPVNLIDRVRQQPAASLTAYRLKRIAHWRQRDFELDRRFVKLILLLDHGPQNEAGRFLESKQGRFDDLGALLAARPDDVAMVLLGRPGCGKTTVLAHHEHELALAALRDPKGEHPFVFWLPLNAFPAIGALVEEPFAWLAHEWSRRNPVLPPLAELLRDHSALLLLDALNEIPHRDPADYGQRLAHWRGALEHLRDEYPHTRAVFTCRSLDYGAGLSDFQRIAVPQVQFEDLGEDAIEEFLRQRLPEHWKTLWEHLRGTTQLELEKTPFYLDLEVRQFVARGLRTASGPAELMSGLIWQALQRELGKKCGCHESLADARLLTQSDRDRAHSQAWLKAPHRLPVQGRLLPGLVQLAHAMQQRRGGGKQIRPSWDEADPWIDTDAEIASRVRTAAWHLDLLLNDIELQECAFRHQLLQEYFAAHALAKSGEVAPLQKAWRADSVNPGLETTLDALAIADPLPGVPATGWEETTVHAAAISSDAEAFVRTVAEQDLVLAARCARSPEVEVSDTLKDELRQQLLARSQNPAADLRARVDAGLALGELGDPRF
ncbi:MAG: NACHT domain-containing protein, partial [Thiotrichales bacterium]